MRRAVKRRRAIITGAVWAGVLGGSIAPARARAEASAPAPPVRLQWNATPPCPSRDQILAEVAQVLAGTRTRAVPVVARVDVSPLGRDGARRWRAALTLSADGEIGTRSFDADTCAAVGSAAALIIALAAGGGAADAPAAMPAAATTAPIAAPTATPAPAPRQIAAHDEPPAVHATAAPIAFPISAPGPGPTAGLPLQLVLGASALVDGGTMPDAPAGGVEATVGASLAAGAWRWRAVATGGYFPGESTFGPRAGEGGRFRLLTMAARVCASAAGRLFDVGPCLGGEIDHMTATGVGTSATFEAGGGDTTWFAASGAVAGTWTLTRNLSVLVRVEALVPFGRRRFLVMPDDVVVHETSGVAARAAMGVELRFF